MQGDIMVNDPIGDLLIQVKNASMARVTAIEVPHSRLKMALSKILAAEGYVSTVEKVGKEPKTMIKIVMKYTAGNEPVITGLKRISKPGLRWYVNKEKIPVVVGGTGVAILSTPQGLMTGYNAKKKGIGGELLCTIW
jgi:small subunit ribosomal protein S8